MKRQIELLITVFPPKYQDQIFLTFTFFHKFQLCNKCSYISLNQHLFWLSFILTFTHSFIHQLFKIYLFSNHAMSPQSLSSQCLNTRRGSPMCTISIYTSINTIPLLIGSHVVSIVMNVLNSM